MIHVDIETFNTRDIRKVPTHRYAETSEITLVAWAVDDGPVQLWDRFLDGGPMPTPWLDHDERWAHNAEFERLHLAPDLRWKCTSVLARYLSLPGALDKAGAILGLPQQKDNRGKTLIRRFCQPRKPSKNNPATRWMPDDDPDAWEEFRQYCRQDVETERALHTALVKYDLPGFEWENYWLDQGINDRGLPIDMPFVRDAICLLDENEQRLMEEARFLTGLDNPNSAAQMRDWLFLQGLDLPNMQRETVEAALLDPFEAEDIRRVLEIRLGLSQAATKKYYTIRDCVSDDDRLRGCFHFYAAHTGRAGGKFVQPQNLRRGYESESYIAALREVIAERDLDLLDLVSKKSAPDTLADLIRSAIAAPPGKTLLVCDLSSIESLVIGWATGCDPLLDIFRRGRDPYRVFASKYFGIPYDQVTKKQRNFSKPPTLGCGFMLSANGLVTYAEDMGVALTQAEAERSVNLFRSMYPQIVDYWDTLMTTMMDVTQAAVGAERRALHVVCRKEHRNLVSIRLPSGRKLFYYKPRVMPWMTPWGQEKTTLTYEYTDSRTRQWTRMSTHGGKLVENIVQAIANDRLKFSMTLVQSEIIGHVHDEIICLCDTDSAATMYAQLEQALNTTPAWAKDHPVGCSGYPGTYYRKD